MLENVIVALNGIGGPWGEAIWRAGWQGGLALAAVWLVCRLWRKMPAGAQCWLWRAAYVKLLVALVWAGTVALPALPGFSPVAELQRSVVMATAFLPAESPSSAVKAAVLPEVPAVTAEPGKPLPAAPAVEGPAAKSAALSSLPGALLLLWLFGVGWGARRLWRARGEARRILRSARPLEDDGTQEVLAGLCERFRLRSLPRLATGEVASPVLLGAWRPVIVLPAGVQPDELPMMLAHELAHVKRRDLAWNVPAAVVETLFFFHPLLWPARREWRLAQEMACDALAVERSASPRSAYGAMLVSVAASGRCAPDLLAAGISESYRTLARRLAAIGERVHLTRRRLLVLGASLLLLGALVLVPWRLVHGQPEEPAPQPDIVVQPADKELLSRITGFNTDNVTAVADQLPMDDPLQQYNIGKVFRNTIHGISVKINFTNFDTKITELLQNNDIDSIDILLDNSSNMLLRITAYNSLKTPHGIPIKSFDDLISFGIDIKELKQNVPKSTFQQAIQAAEQGGGGISKAKSIEAYYAVTKRFIDMPLWIIIADVSTETGVYGMISADMQPSRLPETVTYVYIVNANTGKLIGTTFELPTKASEGKDQPNTGINTQNEADGSPSTRVSRKEIVDYNDKIASFIENSCAFWDTYLLGENKRTFDELTVKKPAVSTETLPFMSLEGRTVINASLKWRSSSQVGLEMLPSFSNNLALLVDEQTERLIRVTLPAEPKVEESAAWHEELRAAFGGFPAEKPKVPLFKALKIITSQGEETRHILAMAERIDAYYLFIDNEPRWVITVQKGEDVFQYIIDAESGAVA